MADLETIELVKDIDVDKYKYGFETDIETELAPKGLNEGHRPLSSRTRRTSPQWMLDWRLEAYRRWLEHGRADLGQGVVSQDRFPGISLLRGTEIHAAPKSLDEVDPKLLETYAKLGIPLKEQEILAGVRKQGEKSDLDGESGGEYTSGKVAVDAVFDSVSVVTTFKDELKKHGVIFCSISEALREHPDLVKQYLGLRRAAGRQLLCRPQCRCVLRWLICLCATGRALPDGACPPISA